MRIPKITMLLQFIVVILLCIDTSRANAQNNYSFISRQVKDKNSGVYLQTEDKNEKGKLINVLKDLNKSKGVYFMFSSQLVGDKIVNRVDDMSENVEVLLDKILKNTGLTYKKINANTFVILSSKDAEKPVSGIQNIGYSNMISFEPQTDFISPNDVITGKVVDKDGNPVAGVSISIKGKKKGTSTNTDGVF